MNWLLNFWGTGGFLRRFWILFVGFTLFWGFETFMAWTVKLVVG